MQKKYAQLSERALANFEVLLNLWQIQYEKVAPDEYDFLSPTRTNDQNLGACRFNITKGVGSDFAGSNFTSADFQAIGLGLGKEDFAGFTQQRSTGNGFDIIGLAGRVHRKINRSDAANCLRTDLKALTKSTVLIKPAKDAAELRQHKRQEQKLGALKSAEKTWRICQDIKGTNAVTYFHSRKIYVSNEPNVKYHGQIFNSELKQNIPAILFKVSVGPDTPLVAIHRIYISKDGTRKAKIDIPKRALGSIQGAGIWFGTQGDTLNIAEGPENALTLRMLGYSFVVCTINAGNFSGLCIPSTVNKIILCPDPDGAGEAAARKAIKAYGAQGIKKIDLMYPPKRKLPNGKLADWNDVLCDLGEKI